jgi:hypothetical protein
VIRIGCDWGLAHAPWCLSAASLTFGAESPIRATRLRTHLATVYSSITKPTGSVAISTILRPCSQVPAPEVRTLADENRERHSGVPEATNWPIGPLSRSRDSDFLPLTPATHHKLARLRHGALDSRKRVRHLRVVKGDPANHLPRAERQRAKSEGLNLQSRPLVLHKRNRRRRRARLSREARGSTMPFRFHRRS